MRLYLCTVSAGPSVESSAYYKMWRASDFLEMAGLEGHRLPVGSWCSPPRLHVLPPS